MECNLDKDTGPFAGTVWQPSSSVIAAQFTFSRQGTITFGP